MYIPKEMVEVLKEYYAAAHLGHALNKKRRVKIAHHEYYFQEPVWDNK